VKGFVGGKALGNTEKLEEKVPPGVPEDHETDCSQALNVKPLVFEPIGHLHHILAQEFIFNVFFQLSPHEEKKDEG
jgi:hypothetical protein